MPTTATSGLLTMTGFYGGVCLFASAACKPPARSAPRVGSRTRTRVNVLCAVLWSGRGVGGKPPATLVVADPHPTSVNRSNLREPACLAVHLTHRQGTRHHALAS